MQEKMVLACYSPTTITQSVRQIITPLADSSWRRRSRPSNLRPSARTRTADEITTATTSRITIMQIQEELVFRNLTRLSPAKVRSTFLIKHEWSSMTTHRRWLIWKTPPETKNNGNSSMTLKTRTYSQSHPGQVLNQHNRKIVRVSILTSISSSSEIRKMMKSSWSQQQVPPRAITCASSIIIHEIWWTWTHPWIKRLETPRIIIIFRIEAPLKALDTKSQWQFLTGAISKRLSWSKRLTRSLKVKFLWIQRQWIRESIAIDTKIWNVT